MKLDELQKFCPEGGFGYIQSWLKTFNVKVKITRSRRSKLGDYRRLPDQGHQISVNGDLPPQLFFMVFTHEIAHLLTLSQNAKIRPHGREWKACFASLLLESMQVYAQDFQPLLLEYANNPKANYMASPKIVRYFSHHQDGIFIEDLREGSYFEFAESCYQMLEKRKKRYLCKNVQSGKKYLFRASVQVKKLIDEV